MSHALETLVNEVNEGIDSLLDLNDGVNADLTRRSLEKLANVARANERAYDKLVEQIEALAVEYEAHRGKYGGTGMAGELRRLIEPETP